MGKYVTQELMMNVHRVTQAILPMDTGNLRYNGTKRYYFGKHGGVNIGGARADYFEYLEEGTEKVKQYKDLLKDTIFPTMCAIVEADVKGEPYTSIYNIAQQSFKQNIGRELPRREARLRASLARSGGRR